MNCQLCNQHMYSYFDGEISDQIKQEIDRHIAQCSSCRFQYDLTRQENLILLDSSDIPALSLDFNQRVLKAVAEGPSPLEDLLAVTKPEPVRRFRLPLYTTAAVAVVLLALCIYVPGIMHDRQERIASKSDQTVTQPKIIAKIPAGNMTAGTLGAAGSVNELKDEHLEIMNDKSTSKITLSLPATHNKEAYGNSSSNNDLDGGTIQWAGQDVGRCDRKFASLAAPTSPNWSLQNIPAQYQLLNMTKPNEHQAEYNYQTPDGNENLTVKIIAVPVQNSEVIVGAVGMSNSEPPQGLFAVSPKAAASVSREIQVGNEKIKLILSGNNLTTEELTNIASNIEINKNP